MKVVHPSSTTALHNMWNQDLYIQAWTFAAKIHLGQKLPGSDIPYIHHLGLVAMEAIAAIANTPDSDDPDLIIQCALLHDSIEDTPTTYGEIADTFGEAVGQGVLALTKNTGLATKREQMADSLRRIRQQPRAVWSVKLCDRITNLQPPPGYWTTEKIMRYRDEAAVILAHLGEANLFLADRLKTKIENYSQYLN
jgi:(p)ppGpp synthase/HD superfamily hydrolase